jgi:CheY-like chemotaxis protein
MVEVSAAAVTPARSTNSTILVAEDEVLVRAMIADELREQGYAVIEAISADEALAVLRSPFRVDLVLTDLRMPGSIDGAGLVSLIRSEFPFVRIVMASSEVPDAELRASLDDFVLKPFLPRDISDCLRPLLPPVADTGVACG